MNSDKVIWGSFAVYPSYGVGILNSVEKIHFYVVCSEQLNYENFIKKCIAGQNCCIFYKVHAGCYFTLSHVGENIAACFETKILHRGLRSSLIFAQSVLKKIRLSYLVYGIVNTNKRVTYITIEVLTSTHDCVFEVYTCNLDLTKRLAACNLYTQRCSENPHKFILSTYSIVQKNLTA